MRLPKYRRRRDCNSGFVEYQGRRLTLPGPADSPESLEAYHAFIRRILAERKLADRESASGPPKIPRRILTVAELAALYLDHAAEYYRTHGKPGTEYGCIKQAIGPLLRLHGTTGIDDFGPQSLKDVRAAMIRAGWARRSINKHVGRIRRLFRWGVESELVPPTCVEALRAVAPLRAGRSEAIERPPIRPVDPTAVDAVLPYATPVLAAMIRLQQLTGMRSANLCLLRPGWIDQCGDVWLYRPPLHKGAWRGRSLVIPLGPRAQEILRPYLARPADACCFNPRESEAQRRNAQFKASARRKPRTAYTPASYRRAIWYAIQRANRQRANLGLPLIPKWTPHQIRHAVATRVRAQYGLEGSQVFLGHATADVTEIYAERDLDLARRIAKEIG